MRSFLKNSLFLSNQSPQSSLSGEPFNNNASSMLLTSLNFFLIFSSTGKSSDPIASLDSSVPYPNPNFKEVFEFDVIFPFLNRPLVKGPPNDADLMVVEVCYPPGSRILIILFPVFLFGLEIFFVVGVELNGVIKLVDVVIRGGGAEIGLKGVPILQQLHLEERLLRTSSDNWCIINDGTNTPTIVMGISGNPTELLEINYVLRDKIPVIKRFTGGGTVIVDHGIMFATFICNKDDVPSVQPYPRPIMSWSSLLYSKVFQGVGDFYLRENDYVFGNHKFGGNAQSITKNR
nr:putative lipoate-protein ligase A isoform X2 [Ipomoea batatas]